MSDGGGVGLNLAMGSINLSGLEDSNVNGIVELPFYKEGHHFIEIFLKQTGGTRAPVYFSRGIIHRYSSFSMLIPGMEIDRDCAFVKSQVDGKDGLRCHYSCCGEV